jgi:hypothetical protein
MHQYEMADSLHREVDVVDTGINIMFVRIGVTQILLHTKSKSDFISMAPEFRMAVHTSIFCSYFTTLSLQLYYTASKHTSSSL